MFKGMFHAEYTSQDFPSMRNFVLDTVEQGKLKNTIYMLIEMDVTDCHKQLEEYKHQTGESISFTGFLLRCFAKAIDEDKHMQAYRRGRKSLMIFEGVDVAVMVEKEIQGQMQPIHYILRNANKKTLTEMNEKLRRVKNASFEEIVTPLDRKFFGKAPDFIRKLFWRLARRDPQVKKQFSGTVGFIIHYILRNANKKTLTEMNEKLRRVKNASFEEIVTPLDRKFFRKSP